MFGRRQRDSGLAEALQLGAKARDFHLGLDACGVLDFEGSVLGFGVGREELVGINARCETEANHVGIGADGAQGAAQHAGFDVLRVGGLDADEAALSHAAKDLEAHALGAQRVEAGVEDDQLFDAELVVNGGPSR